jgi:putative GTP pyrophosphokinase
VEGYSKSRVDRAGRLLADQMERPTASDEMDEAVQIVDWWRTEHVGPLSAVSSNLFRYVSAEGDPVVAQRLKRVPTIAGKLRREKGMRLSRMEDVGGVRAVLPDQDAAYRVARSLRKNWTVTRFRDYVAEPKPDGYRALHLINRNRGRLIEIQLRTPRQDEWANRVERLARHFPGLKVGSGPGELRDWLIGSSELSALQDGSIELSRSRLLEIAEVSERAGTFLSRFASES